MGNKNCGNGFKACNHRSATTTKWWDLDFAGFGGSKNYTNDVGNELLHEGYDLRGIKRELM